MNIFFDLDGTLIDSRKRLYFLFQDLVEKSELSFENYWNLKRNKISHKQILCNQLNYNEEEYLSFVKEWMSKIEIPKYLDYDMPFQNTSAFLENLKKNHTLFLVTARQSRLSAENQIKNFGWEKKFQKILVTAQKQEKYQLIKDNVSVKNTDWFVGDTGKDIETGKLLGIRTAAVLSGFLNEESLRTYNPDLVVNFVTDLNF